MLALLTVLQLVTKLIHRYSRLGTVCVKCILSCLGYEFDESVILHSEMCALNVLQNSLTHQTLEGCVELIVALCKQYDKDVTFPMKDELVYFVYGKYRHLIVKLKKCHIFPESSIHMDFVLGFSILLACFILNEQIHKIGLLDFVINLLGIVKKEDIRKASFVLYDLI
nr:unnamed protein product [Trichobilharzia regenti]